MEDRAQIFKTLKYIASKECCQPSFEFLIQTALNHWKFWGLQRKHGVNLGDITKCKANILRGINAVPATSNFTNSEQIATATTKEQL